MQLETPKTQYLVYVDTLTRLQTDYVFRILSPNVTGRRCGMAISGDEASILPLVC